MKKKRLENENQKYKTDLQEKQNALLASEERLNRLEFENRKLESENQVYKDGWEVDQEIIQSHEREKQKYKTELQQKQNELHAFEKRLGKLGTDNQRLETEQQIDRG